MRELSLVGICMVGIKKREKERIKQKIKIVQIFYQIFRLSDRPIKGVEFKSSKL